MSYSRLAMIVAVTCFPLVASAIDIKGLTLGESLADAGSRAGLTCFDEKPEATFGSNCFQMSRKPHPDFSTIAGEPPLFLGLYGYDGRLGSIRATFSSSSFFALKLALTGKYGEPVCQESEVQNRMGAKFDQAECTWVLDGGVATLARRQPTNLQQASLDVSSNTYIAEMKSRMKKKIGDVKTDI